MSPNKTWPPLTWHSWSSSIKSPVTMDGKTGIYIWLLITWVCNAFPKCAQVYIEVFVLFVIISSVFKRPIYLFYSGLLHWHWANRMLVPMSSVTFVWSGDAVWRHRLDTTLSQPMAWRLTAPSHYQKQCWLSTSEFFWHSTEGNFTGNDEILCLQYEFRNY